MFALECPDHFGQRARRMQFAIHNLWLKTMAGFCAALLLLAGAVDASACASELVAHDLIEHSDVVVSGDGTNSGEQLPETPEQHASCAHGHCHHGPNVLRGQKSSAPILSNVSAWRIGGSPPFRSRVGDGPMEPPRI